MRMTSNKTLVIALFVGLVMALFFNGTSQAGTRIEFAYNDRAADVRVWLDTGHGYDDVDYSEDRYEYDVYPAVDDVVLYVRASRSCYATVYVVDTEGYVHVVHPLSIYDNAYVRGGDVYKIYLSEIGFDNFDRGIAYAYAVSSPVPFDYSAYGEDIFGAGYGFRVHGDPYLASRRFYFSLIHDSCRPHLIGVSHARFYVREYVRYPSYLCGGWHDYFGVRQYCRGNCASYRDYRVHARDPYHVLHPRSKVRYKHRHGEVVRQTAETRKFRHKSERHNRSTNVIKSAKTRKDITERHAIKRTKSIKRTSAASQKVRKLNTRERVVRSSKDSFVKGKSDISKMKRELKGSNTSKRKTTKSQRLGKKNTNERSGKKHVQKKSATSRKSHARSAKASSRKSSSKSSKGAAKKSSSKSGKRGNGR